MVEQGWGLGQGGACKPGQSRAKMPFVHSLELPVIGTLSANPFLFVQDTGTARGRGVFTHRPYEAGEVVEVCPVFEIPTAWGQLPSAVQQVVYDWGHLTGSGDPALHCFALGVGSLFNHTDSPNLSYAADPSRRALVFTATRAIAIGEELTIDYNSDIGPGQDSWFKAVGITPLKE